MFEAGSLGHRLYTPSRHEAPFCIIVTRVHVELQAEGSGNAYTTIDGHPGNPPTIVQLCCFYKRGCQDLFAVRCGVCGLKVAPTAICESVYSKLCVDVVPQSFDGTLKYPTWN